MNSLQRWSWVVLEPPCEINVINIENYCLHDGHKKVQYKLLNTIRSRQLYDPHKHYACTCMCLIQNMELNRAPLKLIGHNMINRTMLIFWLVHSYDLLECRWIDYITINNVLLFSYFKQIESTSVGQGKISQSLGIKPQVIFLILLTNRIHVAMALYSNTLQKMPKWEYQWHTWLRLVYNSFVLITLWNHLYLFVYC